MDLGRPWRKGRHTTRPGSPQCKLTEQTQESARPGSHEAGAPGEARPKRPGAPSGLGRLLPATRRLLLQAPREAPTACHGVWRHLPAVPVTSSVAASVLNDLRIYLMEENSYFSTEIPAVHIYPSFKTSSVALTFPSLGRRSGPRTLPPGLADLTSGTALSPDGFLQFFQVHWHEGVGGVVLSVDPAS